MAETVVVGEPVHIAPDEDVRVATDRIMTAICATVARAREIYPQVPEPGEDDWWVRAPETARLRSCIVDEEHATPNDDVSGGT